MRGMPRAVMHEKLLNVYGILSRAASRYVFPSVGATCVPGRRLGEEGLGGVNGLVWEFQKAQKPAS